LCWATGGFERAPAGSPGQFLVSAGIRPVILASLTAHTKGNPRPGPDVPGPRHSWTRNRWLGCLLLTIVTVFAYQQVWRAGFIWDDDAHVTPPGLRSLHGLWRIWSDTGATQQYYPVLYSAFWVEHRVWRDSAACYHMANVLLHAVAACLLFVALRRLSVPGAFLAAALFAVHPVCVESVAWISEQKNTLSAVFYLLAALSYIAYDRDRRPGHYAVGIVLFALAVLSKSVAATLPAALLVVFWWKRGRLYWRRDVIPLAPWLALGAAAGCMTAWMERTHVGASGAAFALGLSERFLVAGRALWFYLGRLLWPAGLTFIYPRWTIDARDPLQYLFPAAAIAALVAMWGVRKLSRGPLAAALLFAGTLFPALGFINLFPFIYSFVADHFQYMAAAMMLSAAAAAVAIATQRLSPTYRPAAGIAAGCVVAALAVLTWRQCAMYTDKETLWRATIARNPTAWMAYNNLAADLLERGRVDEAIEEVQMSLALGPRNAEAYATLGDALVKKGRLDEALAQYGRALEIEPGNAIAHNNLGSALLQAGRVDEAIDHYGGRLRPSPILRRPRPTWATPTLGRDGRTRPYPSMAKRLKMTLLTRWRTPTSAPL
jgi:tetratricopeptide (TPR) repeat protein